MERHPVLRTFGPRETWLDRSQIELEAVAEQRIGRIVGAEDPLRFAVRVDELHLRLVASRESQVVDRLGVDWEEAHRRSVLGRHVADGGAISEGQARKSGAVELDKLSDDFFLAQHLGHRQHQIGRRCAGWELAVQLESDDFRNQHRHGLSEHGSFRFDSADAPAKDAEPIDHGRVRVGADQRIRIRVGLFADDLGEHALRQVLEVYLVDYPGVGRNHAEVVQRLLSPAQERVALLISSELEIGVDEQCCFRPIFIDLHRVVDDEIDWLERVDQPGVPAESRQSVSHGGEIDDGRHSGEILEEDARGPERDFLFQRALHVPAGQRADVVGFDELAVFVPEQVFEEDLEAEREVLRVPARELGQGIQPKDRVLPTSNIER